MKQREEDRCLLSIIIPVYNCELYIQRCFNSIIAEHHDDIEIILVDDGSTDNSRSICDELSRCNNIKTIVIHKENGGLSSARNAGIDIARGKYLFFLDSDDYMVTGFIPKILDCLELDKYDIIEFKSCLEKEPNTANPVCNDTIEELNSADCIKDILMNKSGNEICFKIFKAELFDDVSFPLKRNYEDIATCYKLMIRARSIAIIDSEYYIYNGYNTNSITKKTDLKNLGDMYYSVNELCLGVHDYCSANHIDQTFIEYYKRHNYIYIYLKLYRNGYKKTELAKEIADYLKHNNKYIFRYLKNYDLKRWVIFELLILLRQI